MNHPDQIAQALSIRPSQVTAVIELLDSGNTIPFISRYRKEATGSLDEEQVRTIEETIIRLRALDERRETIIASITAQEKLTPELHAALLAADTLTTLEDLYQPYKPKRRMSDSTGQRARDWERFRTHRRLLHIHPRNGRRCRRRVGPQ